MGAVGMNSSNKASKNSAVTIGDQGFSTTSPKLTSSSLSQQYEDVDDLEFGPARRWRTRLCCEGSGAVVAICQYSASKHSLPRAYITVYFFFLKVTLDSRDEFYGALQVWSFFTGVLKFFTKRPEITDCNPPASIPLLEKQFSVVFRFRTQDFQHI